MSTPYCEMSDVEDIFGIENVRKWADLDNQGILPEAWEAETEYEATDYVRPSTATGLMFYPSTPGKSSTTEPTWPDGAGETVVDGEVTWTAVIDKVAVRVLKALKVTAGRIDDHLRSSVYAVPLTATGEEMSETVINLNATMAGVWLYEKRGIEDMDPDTGIPIHRLSWHKKEARRVLKEILSGQIEIACVKDATDGILAQASNADTRLAPDSGAEDVSDLNV